MTKSFSMAGWRVAFLVGNPEVVAGAGQAQELPRLRHVPADPDRGHGHAQRGAATTRRRCNEIYQARRDALCDGLDRIGWDIDAAQGHDVRLGADPRALPRDGLDRVRLALVREADVAVSPGVGFGPGGDGHVRFALIENEQRIAQAIRNLKKALPLSPRARRSRRRRW